ncbi:MAG TPA: N,N-dimethylformamidase beta subunit family domain-containing protein [Candidatus Limnocylindrales bacterium]
MEHQPELDTAPTAGGSDPAGRGLSRRGFLAATAGLVVAACGPAAPTGRPSSPSPGSTGPASPASPATGSPSAGIPGPLPSRGPSAVAEENRRPGDKGWQAGLYGTPTILGYLDRTSVAPGDSLGLHVQGDARFDARWYRVGWYRGDGGRLMRVDGGLSAKPTPALVVDAASGRAEEPWPEVLRIQVPPDWPSGMYVVVLDPSAGTAGTAVFIVRPGAVAPASVLYVNAAATWQAYNHHGPSFYGTIPTGLYGGGSGEQAHEISFDRPYSEAGGAGYLPRWEAAFVRWQERDGHDVAYCADLDFEMHPEVVGGRRLLVLPGHHEYWSGPMRDTLKATLATGVSAAFLSANTIYWQVRLEPSPLGPGRRMICYKSTTTDPITPTHPELTTCQWRLPPVSRPESLVIGQMYGHVVRSPADWVVVNSGHWLYEGTGLRDGDRFVSLVGQEYDTIHPKAAPPGVELWAQSPVVTTGAETDPTGHPTVHTATVYTTPAGGTVVAAGTYQWSWALDTFGQHSYQGRFTPTDERVARVTTNIFRRLGDGPG